MLVVALCSGLYIHANVWIQTEVVQELASDSGLSFLQFRLLSSPGIMV